MKEIDILKIQDWHTQNKEDSLNSRWIHFQKIEPLISKLTKPFKVSKVGVSQNNIPINTVEIGEGQLRVLIWSQMHGNENTGTKAVFDLFNFFKKPKKFEQICNKILAKCTLTVIPMLNPDGALVYTRENSKGIDLNRDAISLKAPESKILNTILKSVNPHYCFNLHDQRTIFTVGNTKNPATISFLAPSVDKHRTITDGRKQTMQVIIAMNEILQQIIPNQVGRYTDEFYSTATGDNFQKAGHNTILIEAGHFKGDYTREFSRKMNFIALLQGLLFLSSEEKNEIIEPYLNIPNNTKFYLDIIYKNIILIENNKKVDVGVLFKEMLKNGKIVFKPEIKNVGNLEKFGADLIIDKQNIRIKKREKLNILLKK